MIFIKDEIEKRFAAGKQGYKIANDFGVSVPMISSYRHHSYNPSLKVAKFIYMSENIVLHPFAEESLIWEIKNA